MHQEPTLSAPAASALHECQALFERGEHAELCRRTEPLLHTLAGEHLRQQRCEVLRLLVLAHCELSIFDEALRLAQQISQEAALGKDAGLALIGACSVGTCFDRIGNPWQSMQVLRAALAAHEATAPARPQVIAHINLCAYHGDTWYRLRTAGRDDERAELLQGARRHAELALALLQQHPETMLEMVARGNLAEALLLGGDARAAAPLLDDALRTARERGFIAYGWRMQCTLATLQLAQGDAAAARATAEAVLAAMTPPVPRCTEIRARDIAFQACQAVDDPRAALAHFIIFERLERQRTLAELQSQAQLFVPRAEAERSRWQAEVAREEVQAQSQLVQQAQRRAETDPLTGLLNRAGLQRGVQALADAPWSLAMLDLDHFKEANDRHGHASGDAVLVGFADLLRQYTRAGDLLARVGGEEFVLVLPGASIEAALEVCERLRTGLQQQRQWPAPAPALTITVSIGLVESPGGDPAGTAISPQNDALAAALERADVALYAAKHAGRNRVVLGTGAAVDGAPLSSVAIQ